MVTDLRPYTRDVRKKSLEPMPPREMLERAVSNYHKRAQALARLAEGEEEKGLFLQVEAKDLDRRIWEEKKYVKQEPHNVDNQRRLEDLMANRKILDTLEIKNNQIVIPDLKVPKFGSFKNIVDRLEPYGLIVRIKQDPKSAKQLRDTLDYQVAVFSSRFDTPAPLAQQMLKNPAKTKKNAYAICFNHLAHQWLRQQCGKKYNFHKLRPLKSDSPEKKAEKSRLLNTLALVYQQQAPNTESPLWKQGQHFQRLLGRKPTTIGQEQNTIYALRQQFGKGAARLANPIPKERHLRLIPSRQRIKDWRAAKPSPEDVYFEAFDSTSTREHYLGMVYKTPKGPQRLFLLTAAIQGMKHYLVSSLNQDLKEQDYTVRQADIITTSPSYPVKVKAKVASKSGMGNRYDVKFGPTYRTDHPDVGLWFRFKSRANTDDDDFTSSMHENQAQSYSFADAYSCAAIFHHYFEEEDAGNEIVNPVPVPSAELVYMHRKLEQQALVEKRSTGNLQALNRTSRESRIMNYAIQMQAFPTTHIPEARDAVEELYAEQLLLDIELVA
ncbi:hypothetical protein ACFL0V_01560 [Nanoarchaeota archaeon]